MISVIVPVDDRLEYLIECLNSIRRQKLSPKEMIFVFDGHRRGWDELTAVSKTDPRIILAYLDVSGGPGAARNEGLKIASGEYIAFCDSDDILPVRALERLYKRAAKAQGKADVICGDFLEQFDYGGALRNSLTGHGNKFFRFFSYISVWNRLYKREFLSQYGICFPEGYQGEDLIFLADVFLNNPNIAYTKQIVYQWQRHEMDKKKTLTHSGSYDGFVDLISKWELFYEKMQSDYEKEVKKFGRDTCVYLLNRLYNIKDYDLRARAWPLLGKLIIKFDWESEPIRFYKIFKQNYTEWVKTHSV